LSSVAPPSSRLIPESLPLPHRTAPFGSRMVVLTLRDGTRVLSSYYYRENVAALV